MTEVATVLVRYWAAARAASGVESDAVAVTGDVSLAEVVAAAVDLHPDRPRLRDVVGVCSILVGDRPVGRSDPAAVVVHPGDTVELLPPFAGG